MAASDDLIGSALEVYDEEGRQVFHSQLQILNSKLDLEVQPGVYYLRISNENVSLVRKLVKL